MITFKFSEEEKTICADSNYIFYMFYNTKICVSYEKNIKKLLTSFILFSL